MCHDFTYLLFMPSNLWQQCCASEGTRCWLSRLEYTSSRRPARSPASWQSSACVQNHILLTLLCRITVWGHMAGIVQGISLHERHTSQIASGRYTVACSLCRITGLGGHGWSAAATLSSMGPISRPGQRRNLTSRRGPSSQWTTPALCTLRRSR